MRFDDPAYLDAYRDRGEFPRIHYIITRAALAVTEPGDLVMDLGACTGLITRALADKDRRVLAIEPSRRAVQLGKDYGTWGGCMVSGIQVNRATVMDVVRMARDQGVTTVVARRVFPEISESIGVDGVSDFAAALVDAGVRQFVVEGRVPNSRATNPLSNVGREVAALTKHLPSAEIDNWNWGKHVAVVSV